MPPAVPTPRLVLDADGRHPGRHLLALPEDVVPDEIEVLAVSRFTSARWERPPRAPSRRSSGATKAQPTPGVLRVGRLTTITGPFGLEPVTAQRLGLPAELVSAWVVDTPRERAETPALGSDRDGLRRAFGDRQPVREESRVLHWLVAVARRVGGAVRTEPGVVLVPEVDGALDLTVLCDRWVEPDTVLAAVRRVAPQGRADLPAPTGDSASRVSTASRTGHALAERPDGGIGVADAEERHRLHAEADAFDAHMVRNPPDPEGFGVLVDLGEDGTVSVRAETEHELPLVLHGLAWTQGEVVSYRVSWDSPDLAELEVEHPSDAHRAARGRAAGVVRSVAREVHSEVGGEIADAAGFLVDPVDL